MRRLGAILVAGCLMLASAQPAEAAAVSAAAADPAGDVLTDFQRDARPGRVADDLAVLDAGLARWSRKQAEREAPALIGWLAAVFRRWPDRVPTWTTVPRGRLLTRLTAWALVLAERPAEAVATAQRAGMSDAELALLPSLAPNFPDRPPQGSTAIEIQWGAVASGDLAYLGPILGVLRGDWRPAEAAIIVRALAVEASSGQEVANDVDITRIMWPAAVALMVAMNAARYPLVREALAEATADPALTLPERQILRAVLAKADAQRAVMSRERTAP